MYRAAIALALFTACSTPGTRNRSLPDRESPRAALQRELHPEADQPGRSAPQAELDLADLDALVGVALQENPALRATYRAYLAAVERVPQAERLPDPRFTWIEYTEEIQTRTGPHPRRLQLSQTLPWPGVRGLRGEVAQEAARAAWQQALEIGLDVRRQVEDAWYELGWLEHTLRVYDDNLSLLHQLEPVIQRRIETGGLQEDLLRLQIEIARVEERTQEFTERRTPLRARLAAAIGVDAARLQGAPQLEEPPVKELDLPGLTALALEQSPRLAAMAARVEGARAAAKLSRRERYPDLTLGVDYLQVDQALNPATPGSGDDPFALRLSMNLPIWADADDAAEREADHRLRQAQLDLENSANRLEADVALSVFRYDDAARNLALQRDSLLPRAREAYDLIRASYRAGSASLLDLIDSEQALLDFELLYWNACRDLLQEEARLRALLGGTFE